MSEIKRILCPVDFSETSEHALRYAIDLASKLKADVLLLHVYQLPIYALPDGALMATPDFATQLSTRLQTELNRWVERFSSTSVKVQGRLLEGLAHAEIVSAAKQDNADIIVMGTHGRSGVAHWLLGSVAERVVRSSDVPVITVRAPAKS